MGAGFVPKVLDTSLYNEILACTEEQAYEAAREFVQREGVLVGISAGAALWAACQVGARPENRGKTVAVAAARHRRPVSFHAAVSGGLNYGGGIMILGAFRGGKKQLWAAVLPKEWGSPFWT